MQVASTSLREQFGLKTVPDDFSYDDIPEAPDDLSTSPPAANPGASDNSGPSVEFNDVKFGFQEDLAYPQPNFNIPQLTRYKPHNDHGPGQFAFATYLSTRANSVRDPYFLSAMQLVYRLLWDPKSRSAYHPVVVFVAPFIPFEQRSLLQAAGAIVRELELVPWAPPPKAIDQVPFARWRDLFSKLHIWAQTDFSRIAFLDLDAFPVQNVDGIFDSSVSPRQRCRPELLAPEDRAHEVDMCDYVFAGTGLPAEGVNVGVMVIEPNLFMHQRLLRECQRTDIFDNRMAEQSFLNWMFEQTGPFPASIFERQWNGFWPKDNEEGVLRVVHEKLWIFGKNTAWLKDNFKNGWFELLALYQSPEFEAMRADDGLLIQELDGPSN